MTTEAALWLLTAFFVAVCIGLAIENAALRRHLDTTCAKLAFTRGLIRESSRLVDDDERPIPPENIRQKDWGGKQVRGPCLPKPTVEQNNVKIVGRFW